MLLPYDHREIHECHVTPLTIPLASYYHNYCITQTLPTIARTAQYKRDLQPGARNIKDLAVGVDSQECMCISSGLMLLCV